VAVSSAGCCVDARRRDLPTPASIQPHRPRSNGYRGIALGPSRSRPPARKRDPASPSTSKLTGAHCAIAAGSVSARSTSSASLRRSMLAVHTSACGERPVFVRRSIMAGVARRPGGRAMEPPRVNTVRLTEPSASLFRTSKRQRPVRKWGRGGGTLPVCLKSPSRVSKEERK
jgi:hypothetical protein